MTIKNAKTHWVRIYLSGPLHVIEDECRHECLREGLCVTVDPMRFIYTGGEETGAVVGLINYPRFPTTKKELWERAHKLALKLLTVTCQHSVLIMSEEQTEWISVRGD